MEPLVEISSEMDAPLARDGHEICIKINSINPWGISIGF